MGQIKGNKAYKQLFGAMMLADVLANEHYMGILFGITSDYKSGACLNHRLVRNSDRLSHPPFAGLL